MKTLSFILGAGSFEVAMKGLYKEKENFVKKLNLKAPTLEIYLPRKRC